MNFTISEENHIKHIYHLQQEKGLVNTNCLAESLRTKAASVTDMLKKLKTKKIVQYEPYKGFKLTDSGCKLALSVIRKHRLWEYFLSAKLGFEWDKVHEIAEQLEHINSTELINRLDDFLENPVMDPHGDLIPSRNGKMPVVKRNGLFAAPLNKTIVVCSISNQSPQMLEIMKHNKIAIGTKIKITKRFEFDNSIELKLNNNQQVVLSEQVAKNIFVYDETK